ncbi:hypothetical protein, partial [Caldibacillus debilis]|uniref:hypothetical protein n=1 Tax=Caldibacillus debilis TaxID=301148 RepID=UPI001F19EC09
IVQGSLLAQYSAFLKTTQCFQRFVCGAVSEFFLKSLGASSNVHGIFLTKCSLGFFSSRSALLPVQTGFFMPIDPHLPPMRLSIPRPYSVRLRPFFSLLANTTVIPTDRCRWCQPLVFLPFSIIHHRYKLFF